jgi:osmotically-inducible protein OsmY
MRSTSFYRPCAVVAKAALLGYSRHCFDDIVVENDHGNVVLSGRLPEEELIHEAGTLAAEATGVLVVNHIVMSRELDDETSNYATPPRGV